MAYGDIVSSKYSGRPVYGRLGTILYEDLYSVLITIAWVNGRDIDILGRYEGSSTYVGWGQGASIIKSDGYYAHWRGDNTGEGPEYVDLSMGKDATMSARNFDVYTNLFGSETAGSSGVRCTITATGADGGSRSVTFVPTKDRRGTKAQITDPGARISLRSDGVVTGIIKIN